MKLKIVAFCLFFSANWHFLYGQNVYNQYKDDEIWVIIKDSNNKPVLNSEYITSNEYLNNLLTKYGCERFKKVFPHSKNDTLLSVYSISLNNSVNEFINELELLGQSFFSKIIRLHHEEQIVVYDPSDYMWQSHQEWLWHLTSINSALAWDITKGSFSTKIAILDTWFDINHPDLNQKLEPHYDPFSNTYFSSSCYQNHHGTAVASFAAAHTDGGGQLSSIGFNCMIIPYQAWDGYYIQRAQHASLVMGADVITSSAGGWSCRCSTQINEIEQLAVKEILDNGTIIVMPAGNGSTGTNCRPLGYTYDQPFFPLHPANDNRIIIVTSIGVDNNHYYYDIINQEERTHSHFPEVDICAPGYLVMGAKSTEIKINEQCETNNWPYYGSCIGTSFATPIVAGVCGLIKSVAPCITPEQAKYIIKITASPVNDEYLYSGMIGAGKVNAYEAVKLAGTRNIVNETFSGTKTYQAGYSFNIENTNVAVNSDIILKARWEVNLISSFEVPLGSSFEAIIDTDAVNDCD